MHHVFTQDNHRVFELFVDIKKAGKKIQNSLAILHSTTPYGYVKVALS